jgi:hypothetical protein
MRSSSDGRTSRCGEEKVLGSPSISHQLARPGDLGGQAVLLDADMVCSGDEHVAGLFRAESLEVRCVALDDEAAARVPVRGGIDESGYLLVLGGEVGDRVAKREHSEDGGF